MSGLFERFDEGAAEERLDAPELSIPPEGEGETPAGSARALEPAAEPAPESVAEAATEPPAPARPYVIPDFERDGRELEIYEEAKRNYQRQMLASAERALEASFVQRREQLEKELANARTYEDDRIAATVEATRQYAEAYPHRVDRRGIRPPSLLESLFSLGRAGRLFRAALVASEALDALRTAIRKRGEALERIETELARTVRLKHDQLKKSMESEAGIAEFHARPEIQPLYERSAAICREREDYRRRLEAGAVSDEEQRDRAMGHADLVYAELPLSGTIIAKVERFGALTYFRLRDLEGKETLLSYDPRLDPLRNVVFDAFALTGTVVARVRRNEDRTLFRILDHFKARALDPDTAEAMYTQHRAAMRKDRGLPAMVPCDEAEAAIIERLARLVQSGDDSHPTTLPRN